MLQLLLADDHLLFAEGLRALLLQRLPRVQMRLAGTARLALEMLQHEPDIDLLLADHRLPDRPGEALLQQAAQLRPEVGRVLISGLDDPRLPALARTAGAAAFIHKRTAPERLVQALQTVMTGGTWFDQPPGPAAAALPPGLSDRALQALRLLGCGLGNREIASHMGIGERAVKQHLSTAFQVLGVENRTQALLAARARGLLADEP
jgi:DNA-binding NarL/FixJ family response regulator